MSIEPGWYHGEGDPHGTLRYWNGSSWEGRPVPAPGTQATLLPSAWRRIFARMIDNLLLQIVTMIPALPVIFELTDEIQRRADAGESMVELSEFVQNEMTESLGLVALVIAFVPFVYEVVMVSAKGATLGKMLLGIRVSEMATNESPPSLKASVLRALDKSVSTISYASVALGVLLTNVVGLVTFVSLIMLFANKRRRTVMDYVAGTIVTQK